MHRPKIMRLSLGLLAAMHVLATGQTATISWDVPTPARLPAWMAIELADGGADLSLYGRRAVRDHRELVRELYILRRDYFRATRNVELRQVGISKLRKHATPDNLPVLLEVFRREHPEVRRAMLDLLAEHESAEADTALAWAAVFDSSQDMRNDALERLRRRIAETGGEPSDRVVYVVAQGIKRPDIRTRRTAAQVADVLNIVQVIPHLIAAQVGGGGSAQNERTGDLAWILVGKQRAFVSDLQPVVAESAVAFDPQLSVVTEGVLIRVSDASVVTYISEVHSALVGIASRASGEDLSRFGYDQERWARWYIDEFIPAQRLKTQAAQIGSKAENTPKSTSADLKSDR
ncbi:MAG: HEAT repeat domain-containing protein [Phycisphaeraceae bacterium]|nr:HEAT repeat domain-containing protein [Phycisphaeraceae bacterium]MCW5753436.1 HEAT repeat domain-containing protein [Phycisphaeraceae bacterium]